MAALAGGRPTLWVVEDVHWAGNDLLAFLDATLEVEAGDRFILATARPSLTEDAPDWLARSERLDLGTLPTADTATLVETLVGDALPAALVASIAERSDGNPLFVEELLRAWIGAGILAPADGASWRLTVGPGDVVLPPTVQAIYAAQLDDLPPSARLVARRASVLGRRFGPAAFPPLGLEGERPGLETLRRRGFVSGPEDDEAGEATFAYRHALLRDAGYSSLARLERARLHAALARWMDETAGPAKASAAHLVARHYAEAAASLPAIGPGIPGLQREPLRAAAADAFEQAASASLALFAHEEAIDLLRRAIEHTDPGAAINLARRRLRLGAILADAANLDAGITELAAATESLAGELPAAAATYAESAYRLGVALMQQIRFDEAEALSAAAIERLAEVHEPGRVRLSALHAWTVAAQGRDDGAGDEARAARRDAGMLDDAAIQVDALEHCAAALDELGTPEPAAWADLEARARAAGRWRQVANAARVGAVFVAEERPADALARLDAAADEAHAHGLTEQGGWLDLTRCETLWVLGRWDEALVAGERAIALGERHAYDRLTFRTWMVVLPLKAARGDASGRARYEAWMAAAEARLPKAPSWYAQVLRAATRRWLALAEHDPDAAGEPPDHSLAEAYQPFSNAHVLAALETLVEWWLASDRDDSARLVAARHRHFAAEADSTPLMRASSALVDAWVTTDAAARRDAAQRSLAVARRLGARWWEVRALRAVGADASALEADLGIR
jgi:tetratricopeptide (TPR) repeat protein